MPFDKSRETPEARILRVWDLESCKKLAHRHAFAYANDDRERELETLWVREPENMKTASFGSNWGYYIGMDEIRRYYIDGDPTPAHGFSAFQPMSSWTLEVASDGKTAYGVWDSISQRTVGEDAFWHNQSLAFDFIKEADGWRIWRLFVGNSLFLRVGDSLSEYPCELVAGDDANPLKAEFGEPTVKFQAYTAKFNWSDFPPLPVPHDTWTPAMSCGIEGNPNYKA